MLEIIHLVSNDDQENWNAHYKFMQPLFNSYDNKISELMNENKSNKGTIAKVTTKNNNLLKENANLQGKINNLLNENSGLKTALTRFKSENEAFRVEIDRLKSELSTISHQSSSQQQQNPSSTKFNLEQWEEANAKIEVLEQENDLLIKQQNDNKKEIESMKMEVCKKNNEVQSLTKLNNENKKKIDTLVENLKILNNKKMEVEKNLEISNENFNKSTDDNTMLHNDLCRAMNEIREYKKKLSEYKKSLEEITVRYQTHVREASEMAANEKKLIGQLKLSDEELTHQKENYANALEEINNLRNQQAELLQLSKEMEKRINELEEKEVDLNKQIQHRIDIAEEAKLNCDRALLKEDQYIKEIQRLKNSLTENTSKFSEKSEQSLSLIVSKYETEKQKLLKEIDMLEVSNTEARNQVERAIRDKKTMEMRLERLSKQIPEDQERINLIIEDLTTRLNNSEREKDEIALKYEKLSDKNNREQNKIEKDKECLQIQLDDVYRRVRRSERELEDTKVKELSNNLENATNSYSKVSLEYQQLLSEQRKMSDKW
ncbi:hypothetical protein LY90DRAFT_498786 [Neocallimastix californiae]|uniref:Uncharacterized protein n=1 Tax=Neocallimastix californiae TaxID=1754190 RepID=A0A1Y2FRE4_9FUNG|nr:hypothetical protein LY90DRAFT_498786 [Neocallimastix californiae]|eukprot:ORY86553.1 hypothetical protein LY90DRAFT_498786 [Neocallimastix californiae]